MDYFEEVLEEERLKVAAEKIQRNLCYKLNEEEIPASIKKEKVVVELSEGSVTITAYEFRNGWRFVLCGRCNIGVYFLDTMNSRDGEVQEVVKTVKDILKNMAKYIAETEVI